MNRFRLEQGQMNPDPRGWWVRFEDHRKVKKDMLDHIESLEQEITRTKLEFAQYRMNARRKEARS